MQHKLKQVFSFTSVMIFTLATMIGIPLKSYAKLIEHDPKCVEVGPKHWTPYMVRTYTRAYLSMNYPEWNKSEWKALVKLWNAESHWNPKADNPKSTAYGVAQVLNTEPGTPAPQQVARGLQYIEHRYGKPSAAWTFHRKNGWY